MLDVHAVRGFGPEAEDEQAVDDGWDGEGEIVEFEPFGPEPKEEDARDGGDEDADGDGGVVEEACGGDALIVSMYFHGSTRVEGRHNVTDHTGSTLFAQMTSWIPKSDRW